MDVLELNINEFVSKQVTNKIETLNKQLNATNKTILLQNERIAELQKSVNEASLLNSMIVSMREAYYKIEYSTPDDGGWFESKEKQQFEFFANLMKFMFGVEKKQQWISSRNNGRLKVYLAVNYYDHKNDIMNLVDVVSPQHTIINTFIKSFVMPNDYQKADVIEYVTKPHYCTNGAIFGVSSYWLEEGAGKRNLPHDLIMKNPYILEDDVFDILLDTIQKNKENSFYLFGLPKYNSKISDEQVSKLGECLIGLSANCFNFDIIKQFITENMDKFNAKTLDFLFTMVTKDNQYRVLHWEKFPSQYQEKFILSMSIEDSLKALISHSCKLSPEEKISLLKKYD